ncbi:hypothetical protein [uncultured Desulfovibrio sp.]|uniref:hypothetical protein n=1 Tax=uncultured Desulfovibrio sp. TaxID=167968 RepID=UPI00259A12ED|nr:hypothetical protein [uncultured Desulfovibrio sp.]
MDLFQFVDRLSSEPCLINDELYIAEGKWFRWEHIQLSPLDVASLKKCYGDRFSLSLNFVGKLLVKAGVRAEGKSFIWCGEKTVETRRPGKGVCEIDLGKIQAGTLEISLHALEESVVFDDSPIAVEKAIRPEHVLYDFLSPTYELCCEEPLYYRFIGERAYYSFGDKTVHLKKDSSVDLLTYFNAFSAVKWKKYTNVDQVSMYLDFEGEARAEAIHICEKGKSVLAAWKLKAGRRTTLELPLGAYPDTGIIGLHIHAEQECTLYGGGYLTDAPETQPVRLGIGITTYRREDAVKASVARLGKAIAEHPLYHDAIDITVVDNGQTLVPEDVPAATLIPSRNLGGTGGFMRSLIHYQDEGKYTHCLFMDDDASCEAGSLFRSMSFMRHAKDISVAVSGAMLSENVQFIQWENGAYFDKCCHPMHCNYDLRDSNILVLNEKEDAQQPTYGAWWFFMFPINKVETYSFPFFVRGDDIEFSYTNEFNIVRMNGIGVWQEDFKTKESPMTLYLDVRSHVLHHLVLEHIDHGPMNILKMVWSFFRRFNWSYQYDTANAILTSFMDMQQGPKYWLENMDIGKIRTKIKEKYSIEVSKPLRKAYKNIPVADKNIRLPYFTLFFRKISLNGHLAPSKMVQKQMNCLHKYEVPFMNRVFLRDNILVCNEINNTEFVLKRNPRYFLYNFYGMIVASIKFYLNYSKLKKHYQNFLKTLKSDKFWRENFNQ